MTATAALETCFSKLSLAPISFPTIATRGAHNPEGCPDCEVAQILRFPSVQYDVSKIGPLNKKVFDLYRQGVHELCLCDHVYSITADKIKKLAACLPEVTKICIENSAFNLRCLEALAGFKKIEALHFGNTQLQSTNKTKKCFSSFPKLSNLTLPETTFKPLDLCHIIAYTPTLKMVNGLPFQAQFLSGYSRMDPDQGMENDLRDQIKNVIKKNEVARQVLHATHELMMNAITLGDGAIFLQVSRKIALERHLLLNLLPKSLYQTETQKQNLATAGTSPLELLGAGFEGLTMPQGPFTDKKLFEILSWFPNLTTLDMGVLSLNKTQWPMLIQAIKMMPLKQLRFNHFSIPSSFYFELATHFPHLESLTCRFSELEDNGIFVIVAGMTKLTFIDMSGSPKVSDEGARTLVRKMPQLKTLIIEGCSGLSKKCYWDELPREGLQIGYDAEQLKKATPLQTAITQATLDCIHKATVKK